MDKTLKKMFLAIEVNLLLWLAVWGTMQTNREFGATLVVVGLVFAAVVQHWAYYACHKRAKEIDSAES